MAGKQSRLCKLHTDTQAVSINIFFINYVNTYPKSLQVSPTVSSSPLPSLSLLPSTKLAFMYANFDMPRSHFLKVLQSLNRLKSCHAHAVVLIYYSSKTSYNLQRKVQRISTLSFILPRLNSPLLSRLFWLLSWFFPLFIILCSFFIYMIA